MSYVNGHVTIYYSNITRVTIITSLQDQMNTFVHSVLVRVKNRFMNSP